MDGVTVRFYAELNDHLPPEDRYRPLERPAALRRSVKDLIESFGVPHTEVELIVVNGESVGFDRLAGAGDRVAVYPVFESFDVAGELRVRGEPLRDPRFVLDIHLGRLAGYLRMLGFDASYGTIGDAELAHASAAERRILLTRDRGLLMHGSVTHGYWLRETDSRRQLEEVIARFDLARRIEPFTRCMACNRRLAWIAPEEAARRVPRRIAELYREFRQCPACARIYWKGSHHARMARWIGQLAGA